MLVSAAKSGWNPKGAIMAVPKTNASTLNRIKIEKKGPRVAITIEGSVALLIIGLAIVAYLIHLWQ